MRDEYDRDGNPHAQGDYGPRHRYAKHQGGMSRADPENAQRIAELEQVATAKTALERAKQRAAEQEANAACEAAKRQAPLLRAGEWTA